MSSTISLTLRQGGEVDFPSGLFINNEFVPSESGSTITCYNPATGKELATVAAASSKDVDHAVESARKAFDTTWGRNSRPEYRSQLINKLADLMERDLETIARIESQNSGKGVRIAREIDVPDSIACLRYYAGYAGKVKGETIEVSSKDKMVYTTCDPIGVVAQIVAWNYPLLILIWKLAPALAAGCAAVIKPSELTPLSALYLCQLVKEAGFPAGVVNVVNGLGSEAGSALSSHMNIDKIAFTGSVPTGRRIMVAAATSNLKKVTLELGGKSANIVFASADQDQAAAWSALAAFFNSGQECCAGTRLFVQDTIYDEFMPKLIAHAKNCAIGDPSDEATSFGPLITADQRDKVAAYVQSGLDEGAELATGGKFWGEAGHFFEPTILVNTRPDMKCVREEIFGPVLVVAKFRTEEEVVKLANDSIYGLAAGVHTSDAKQAMRVSGDLLAGSVWVNHYGAITSAVPFGGMKASGIGRELGSAGILAYCETKSVQHNFREEMSWPI